MSTTPAPEHRPESADVPGSIEGAAAAAAVTAEPAQPAAARPGAARSGRPALYYTLLRMGLFAGVLLVVWLLFRYPIGLTGNGAGILAVGIALAVSGVLSYFLLNNQREAMSAALVARVERAKARIEEGASAEDDLVADGR
ncbi:DUF4229 domain-containing protein [Yinghuangia seranimata]|uniref:DUF4229 domain-containing protein n=1 Tax=Yinghuangia seranimata TaxID=408067 RepID=UPI00248BAE31|nr:DUF4229 domain-containing protein [Yinghuangia seranimata]MDI2127024.1 DUF4229 domain-containing protein [Yinghuangia seranimata]